MRHALLITLSLSALLTSSALAEERPLVGVLNFTGAKSGLNQDEVESLTEVARMVALEVLGHNHDIITRESMESLLQPHQKLLEKCWDGGCPATIGRSIGAELIVSVRVARVFKKYKLTVEITQTDPPKLLNLRAVTTSARNTLRDSVKAETLALLRGAFPGLKIASAKQTSKSASRAVDRLNAKAPQSMPARMSKDVEQRPLIGVLDLKGAEAKLSTAEVNTLTGLVREKAIDLLKDRYDVITRESLEDLLKASGKTLEKCLDAECETEIGRQIGAKLVVTGAVRDAFGALNLELKIHSTEPPKALGIKTTRVKLKAELPEAIEKLATTLFEAGFSGDATSGATRPGQRSARDVTRSGIAAGSEHTCALDFQGRAVCWGENRDGRSNPPTGSFNSITSGILHTCALDSQGKAVCWGDDNFSQSTPPKGVFTTITAGGTHTCALDSQGRAVCWGENRYGQSNPPAGSFNTITAGGAHTCALDSQGRAVCWGYNKRGQRTPPLMFQAR